MKLYQKALLVAAGVVVFQSGAMETGHTLPLMQHRAAGGFGPSTCLPSGAWQSLLTVTGDVPGGTARIATQATPFDLPIPVSYLFTIPGGQDTYTVTVTVSWPTPFTAPPMTFTATGPSGGCTPPTTPPVTTCVDAIPPRDDCGSLTAQPVDTVPPTFVPPVTMVNPENPPVPTTSSATSTAPTPTTPSPTVPRPLGPGDRLAATGSAPAAAVGVGIFFVACGVALLAGRRKRAS